MSSVLTERRRKEIMLLRQKKHRMRRGEVLVEGVRSVASALAAEAPLVDVLTTPAAAADARLQGLLEKASVPVYTVDERMMARLSDVQASQGVLAVVRSTWAEAAVLQDVETVLVLDAVQDPGNVGTLLRTAAWFGVDAVVAGPGTADVFNPKAVRAAMGGLWDLHLVRMDDLGRGLAALQAAGFTLYGADMAGTPAPAWTPRRPSALVLGSEAHGLSPAVLQRLNARIAIPGTPRRQGVESLNVAVAAGILIYQWKR